MKKNQKGFTIVELVIVIVVIGVLSAILAPKLGSVVGGANEAQQKANVKVLKSALTIAYGNKAMTSPNNPYPTLSELVASTEGTTVAANGSGVCVGAGQRVATYSDDSATTQTNAAGNYVRSVGNVVVADTISC
jgi:prepilin-type N-terminal cleavage/methylation domain-containing protein